MSIFLHDFVVLYEHFVIFKEFYSDFLNFSASAGLSTAFVNLETPDGETFNSLSALPASKTRNIPDLYLFTALHPWQTETAEKWEKTSKKILENILKKNTEICLMLRL